MIFSCDLCNEGEDDEIRVPAEHICKICGARLCTLCANHHIAFFKLEKHKVISLSESESEKEER